MVIKVHLQIQTSWCINMQIGVVSDHCTYSSSYLIISPEQVTGAVAEAVAEISAFFIAH